MCFYLFIFWKIKHPNEIVCVGTFTSEKPETRVLRTFKEIIAPRALQTVADPFLPVYYSDPVQVFLLLLFFVLLVVC